MFAEVELAVAVDATYIGVGFIVAALEPAADRLSLQIVCRSAFALVCSLN
jgi:hypothetical protein